MPPNFNSFIHRPACCLPIIILFLPFRIFITRATPHVARIADDATQISIKPHNFVPFSAAPGSRSGQQAPLVGRIQVRQREQDIQFGGLFSQAPVPNPPVLEAGLGRTASPPLAGTASPANRVRPASHGTVRWYRRPVSGCQCFSPASFARCCPSVVMFCLLAKSIGASFPVSVAQCAYGFTLTSRPSAL